MSVLKDLEQLQQDIAERTVIQQELRAIKESLELLRQGKGDNGFWDLERVARYYSFDRAYLYKHPYLMPNFGESDGPSRSKRWSDKTVKAWNLDDVIGHYHDYKGKRASGNN